MKNASKAPRAVKRQQATFGFVETGFALVSPVEPVTVKPAREPLGFAVPADPRQVLIAGPACSADFPASVAEAKQEAPNVRSVYRLHARREKVELCEGGVPYGAKIRTSADAAPILRALLGHEPCEVVLVLLLDVKHAVIGYAEVGRGGISSCSTSPADIFRPALLACAASIILSHNHPSGDPSPSSDDIGMTAKVAAAGKLLGVPLLDHVIVADQRHFSFTDSGRMPRA